MYMFTHSRNNAEVLGSVVHRIADGLAGSQLDPNRLTVLARTTFLADWRSTIETGEAITQVAWELTDYAPDFLRFAEQLRVTGAEIDFESRVDGFPGVVRLGVGSRDVLTDVQGSAVEHVVEVARRKSPTELQRLVESTFPMLAGEVGILPLPELARVYNEEYRFPQAS